MKEDTVGEAHRYLLTLQLEHTPEGVFAYCPELDIYTSGSDQAEAERKFAALLFEYYDVLDNNRAKLDDTMRSHLEFYESKLLPQMLRTIGEYPRYAQELRQRFQSLERQDSGWEKVTSSNLVKLCRV